MDQVHVTGRHLFYFMHVAAWELQLDLASDLAGYRELGEPDFIPPDESIWCRMVGTLLLGLNTAATISLVMLAAWQYVPSVNRERTRQLFKWMVRLSRSCLQVVIALASLWYIAQTVLPAAVKALEELVRALLTSPR